MTRGAITLAQAISSNAAEDRHIPGQHQSQKDSGALKSYVMNTNDQMPTHKQMPMGGTSQQHHILSQQVL